MSLEHYDIIVIGGGQAGLAIGHQLARQDRRFTILDAAPTPAAAWRSRWHSLRLFTPARHNSLPGLAFPGDPDHYPGRDEVVSYLTDYARHFELPVELDSRATAVHAASGGYRVELTDRALHAHQVVIATGPFQVPRVPALAGELAREVVQLHSAAYQKPSDLPTGRVLVVGGGNTGFQIAEELAASRDVHLAIGSRQTPLPQRILGRDLFGYLTATGLMNVTVSSRIGHRLKDREALIGSSPRAARKSGIAIHPRATHATGSAVAFADGSRLDVDAVVWATGFDRDVSWVDAPVFDHRGELIHDRGVTPSPGLYFLGMPWQHTRGSALLGWVKHDAQHIAERIRAPILSRHALA
jgi:putative flavoprotein involved in K+ transport